MLLATALALLITGCAQQTFTVQNKPAAVAPRENHLTSFLRFWNWAEENIDAAKFVAAQKVLKQKPKANIRKWIAPVFVTLGIYTPLESACVLLTQ